MHTVLIVFQIVVSILFVLCVLTQQKSAGLSATFGGSGTFYGNKRGAEKFLATSSWVLAIFFVLNALAFLFI